jgi:hypothetical protein
MALLDARGEPVDPVERAMARLARAVEAGVYGDSPEQRVHDLRRTVLGEEAGPSLALTGLAAWLPPDAPPRSKR